MSARVVIKGGHVVDPERKINRDMDVIIENGLIEDVIAPQEFYDDCEIIDATDCVVSPGFIDLHVHLREPGYTGKETISTGTRAAAKGGFTTVCAMPNTQPVIDSPEMVQYLDSIIQRAAHIRVEIIGAVTRGLDSEEITDIHHLAELGVVGFSNDGLAIASPMVMRRALELAGDVELPIINHAEDSQLVGKGVMHEGEVSLRLGLYGTPSQSESVMVARDIELAALTGATIHIPHVSTLKSVRQIEMAKEAGIAVTAEVTPHHLRLSDRWIAAKFGEIADVVGLDAYDTNTRVNPPLREQDDIDILVDALGRGVIDVVATDHAPHNILDKEGTFCDASPGISGLETAFGLVAQLVHDGKLKLTDLIERLTCAPAKIIKRPLGTLKKGYSADVVLLDLNKEWVVETDKFVSLGRNTPLDGFNLKGSVSKTIYKGIIVYEANE